MADSVNSSSSRHSTPTSSSESETSIKISKGDSYKTPGKNSKTGKKKLRNNHTGSHPTPLTKLDRHKIQDALDAQESSEEAPVVGLTKDQFLAKCKEFGFSDEEYEQIIDDVENFIANNIELDEADKANIAAKKTQLEKVKKLPQDASIYRQIKTTAAAGTAAYLTSFLLGKIASNLTVYATGTPYGVFAFAGAGVLNALITEPVANAIRNAGAAYGSPDGVAYTDYRTASYRLKKAKKYEDQDGIRKWTKICAGIVDSVIAREQTGNVRLCSGVDTIKRDDNGNAVDKNGQVIYLKKTEESVMARAKLRAFLTDDLPFYFFTLNYTVSGSVAPLLKASFSPLAFVWIDIGISASLGMLSGAQTAMTQNFLRKEIQGAKLIVSMPTEVKGAQLALVSASMEAWQAKLTKFKQIKVLIDAQLEALHKQEKAGEDVRDVLEVWNTRKDNAIKNYKKAKREWKKARSLHGRHSSQLSRVGGHILSSMSAYSGEKTDDSKPMEGRRALNRTIAKLIAYPMSLCVSCLYNSLVIPAVISATTSHNNNPSGFSMAPAMPDMAGSFAPASADIGQMKTPSPVSGYVMAASTLAGLPLIFGFMLRIQWGQGIFERCITAMEREKDDKSANSDDDDSSSVGSPSTDDSGDENDASSSTSSASSSSYLDSDAGNTTASKKTSRTDKRTTPSGGETSDDEGYSTASDKKNDESESEV